MPKITALDDLATPVTADVVAVVDDIAGTATTKKATIANLATTILAERSVVVAIRYFQVEPFSFPSQTDHTTGDGKATIIIPPDMNGMSLIYVLLSLETAGVDDLLNVQIRNETDSVDMLSTAVTVDTAELTSATAVTPYVIYDDGKEVIATGDEIDIDVDAIHSGTAGKGLIVTLGFS